MKLTLTTDDGEVLAVWDVEEEFGNLDHSGSRAAMAADITTEWKAAKAREHSRTVAERINNDNARFAKEHCLTRECYEAGTDWPSKAELDAIARLTE